MIIGDELRFAVFPVLVFVGKPVHRNTNDDKSDHRNPHGYPKKAVGNFSMVRCHRQGVSIKICKGIPQESADTAHGKYHEKECINFIIRVDLSGFRFLALHKPHEAADPEDHVQNGQHQNNP